MCRHLVSFNVLDVNAVANDSGLYLVDEGRAENENFLYPDPSNL